MDIVELLNFAREKNASDLHLSPYLQPRLRIDGELQAASELQALPPETIAQLLFSVLSDTQQQQFLAAFELDVGLTLQRIGRVRLNVFKQCAGMAAVFRLIPGILPTFETLELPDVFKTLLTLPHGLILITGPTGSGKSTTLAAMINEINLHQALHIITIEDPIEFIHPSKKSLVNQREVMQDTASFAKALRATLRQDPDVILLGELRDLKTIRLALTAAETGHLVMATLHTSSATRTIHRIIDVFPAQEKNIIRNLLAESLQAVICQTLLKQIRGGRVAAFETMLITPAIRNLIKEDKIAQISTVIQTSREIGMTSLEYSVQKLAQKNKISQQTASVVMGREKSKML